MEIIGETSTDSFILKKVSSDGEQEVLLLDPNGLTAGSPQLLLRRKISQPSKLIRSASLQILVTNSGKSQLLLALVYETSKSTSCNSDVTFTSNLFLLENLVQRLDDSPNIERFASIVILEDIPIVCAQTQKLCVQILPPNLIPNPLVVETPCLDGEGMMEPVMIFRNQVIALSLGQCITIYDVETTLSTTAASKIEILSSEAIPKHFWWSEWIPAQRFLAFLHWKKSQYFSFEENNGMDTMQILQAQPPKPILSVLQFHQNHPHETVLNLPMDFETPRNPSYNDVGVKLLPKPNLFATSDESNPTNFRVLVHKTGAVYIFRLHGFTHGTKSLVYEVNALHHNKTIRITTDIKLDQHIAVDVCLYHDGQFLIVLGYPHFLHLLDIGAGHDPSHHHLLLDWESFSMSKSIIPLAIYTTSIFSSLLNRHNQTLNLLTRQGTKIVLDISAGFLTPLALQRNRARELNWTLAIIHYLMVHMNEVNTVKKILYELVRSLTNPHLTEIFQEFVVAHTYATTGKQLMPNMKIFLHFLPYSSLLPVEFTDDGSQGLQRKYSIEVIRNFSEVSSILLSPRQRVLPSTVTDDIWNQLWDVNEFLRKSTRFSHRNIAQKLLLSLQCYQPEALSRATTPMSPSSPMLCNNLGDIAALFGRKSSELQLPFLEQESCTANKQEYVYSIYLRELSTHLLKERRDWPLHGQTVAGKYMNALVESARLLCHVTCLTLHHQLSKIRGFDLIDSLAWETKLKLFMLFEMFSIALGRMACPLPQGFTPFFAYLGYRVLKYDQFLWHLRSDLSDAEPGNVAKKLHLISLLPKSRASRVLNNWAHPAAISLRARQHASDLLSGATSLPRKPTFASQSSRVRLKNLSRKSPLDTFFQLLTAKASAGDIDLGLLTEATMISMQRRD